MNSITERVGSVVMEAEVNKVEYSSADMSKTSKGKENN